ncbi:hypothetical protein [Jiella marina]|uniref:hypothetical protein n=1 Tax=Jiella sp. LLJ827 TaxID=2917712 RepID=UPI002100DAB3|nr:hypothetical protein [Jiella sp. LLJ827]MCQ0989593.1 hypothetical protein [Jiella sp. LLJ827]
MTHPPISPDSTAKPDLSLSVDWELYASYLEESDASDEDKQALIKSLFAIVLGFVDLGFRLNPVQHCGGDGGEEALRQIIAEHAQESGKLPQGDAHE